MNFIYSELDAGTPSDRRAVATMAIDLSKAFNRIDHGKLMVLLFDMGVPTCALRLLYSYLSNRTMRVHLSDVVSEEYELWGGGPQGGLLTVLLFNIYSNWITDVCQPGLSQADRFLLHGNFVAPSCSHAQRRDCPPDILGRAGHTCCNEPPCSSWQSSLWLDMGVKYPQPVDLQHGMVQLNPEAAVFKPATIIPASGLNLRDASTLGPVGIVTSNCLSYVSSRLNPQVLNCPLTIQVLPLA